MENHHARTGSRRNCARGKVALVVAVMALAVISVVCAGCGRSVCAAEKTLAAPPQAVTAVPTTGPAVTESGVTASAATATAPVAHPAGSLSLHERVMAEQGRGLGAAPAAARPTTTATAGPASPPQSETIPLAAASVEQDSPTAVILTGGRTPLRGVWSGTAEQLASFLMGVSPSPLFTVPAPVLAEYYVLYCGEAGLRADLLWAQMLYETGYGLYGGDVLPEQNNFAGIGATGHHEPGVAFVTAEAGVMAHVAHMVAYVYPSSPVWWADATTDPRFDFVDPRGVASVLADLNGRWAVPGVMYGENIEAIAWAINEAAASGALPGR